MKSVGTKRNETIDVARGIAILLVVVGHCIQYSNGTLYLTSEMFFENSVFKWIYGFHMPLFMLISGYLFSLTIRSKTTGALVRSRFYTLLVPIFAWGVLDVIAGAASRHDFHELLVSKTLIKNYLSACFYGLWFLWAVFYNSLIVIVIFKYLSNSKFAYIAIGAISLFSTDNYNFHLYKFMYPFFILPFLFAKTVSNSEGMLCGRQPSSGIFLAIVLMACYCGIIAVWEKSYYIYVSGFSLLGKDIENQFSADLIRLLAGFAGSFSIGFFILSSGFLRGNASWQSILGALGRRSLGIYIISGFAFSYLIPKLTRDLQFSWPRVLIITLIVTATCAIATEAMSRVKIVNAIFLGGRKQSAAAVTLK